MKKKTLACFLAAILCLPALTGCGNTGSAKNEESADRTEAGAVGQETQNASDGVVSLTLWGAEEDQELLAEIVESFKAEYAGQAEFEITIVPEGEATCRDNLLADLKNGPDVFAFADDQLMTMVAAGALLPAENADEIRATNSEGAIAAASVNDVLYAYPMTADNGYFMYYNKEYFTEADVQTLDSMLNIAAENEKKVAMDWSSGWYLYSFFGATGLTVGLNDDGISNYCTWNDTTGAIKGVDVAEAMLAIGAHPGFGNMTDSEFIAGVQDGSVIAGVSGVWDASAVEAAWGNNYAAVKLPTYTCAGSQVQMSSFAGYKMVGANAYSDYPEWASKLAAWITNEENQALRFEKRSLGPSNINAASSSAVQQSPAIQALIQQSDYASLQRIGGAYWDPVAALGSAMSSGDLGGIALQEYLDQMVEKITASNT